VTLRPIDYDEVQHAAYAEGRALPAGVLETWLTAWARWWPAGRAIPLLDLGSGVGRFTPGLAGRFGGPVYGVEPSARMRAIAEAGAAHPNVRYLAGEAAHIPLPDGAVEGALMFLSLHHVPDRAAAAREIARVLRPGARLQIVSGFADRLAGASWWHRFFPGAADLERRMFPTVDAVTAPFAAAGLALEDLDRVEVRLWDDIASAAAQLRLRPYSTFEHLSEAEILKGQADLDAGAARDTSGAPIMGLSDRMVLRRE
jgi:SAM-dependent methyltransferase